MTVVPCCDFMALAPMSRFHATSPVLRPAGEAVVNVRDLPHAGYTLV
jgi:hypothetical protein